MTRSPLQQLVLDLYADLERLAEKHVDLTDTDVREALHETLNYHFVWGRPVETLPVTYRLFSLAGDRALGRLVRDFLARAVPLAEEADLAPGPARLDVLQDDDLVTRGGRHFDEYLGSTPEPLPPDPPSSDLYRRPHGRELWIAALVALSAIVLGGWLLSRLP